MASLLKYSFILMFVISHTVIAKTREKGLTLKAPLIHWSSPESPFHRPNATPAELLRASISASRARVKRIHNKLSGKYSGQWAVSPVNYTGEEFLMKFSLGTPPIETYALPDTGSELVWFQCKSCSKCYPQKQPLFDPTQSTTYKTLLCSDPDCKKALGDKFSEKCTDSAKTCEYQYDYVDGSYSAGVISEDVFTFEPDRVEFGDYVIKDAVFGCGLNNSEGPPSPYGDGVPGIVGLSSGPASLVSQLTLGVEKQFSYCMAVPDEMTQPGTIEIQFGPAASVSGPSTALAKSKYGLYFFQDIEGLYSNSEKVDVWDWMFEYTDDGVGGVLMDTGATHTHLRKHILDKLVEVLKEQIEATDEADKSGIGFALCYSKEDWDYAYLPDIELRFKNTDTIFPFLIDNSWISNHNDQYCLDFISTSDGWSVIGMQHQRGIQFGYDLQAYTVSFMETRNCAPYENTTLFK